MRLLATLMATLTILTAGLFAHALATVDEPDAPVVARAASR
jgi:hypothetical protein